jgi:hypothetical protein
MHRAEPKAGKAGTNRSGVDCPAGSVIWWEGGMTQSLRGRPNPDRRPVTVLLQRDSAVAGQFEAGDQGAGDGGAAAQRSFRRVAIDLRQKNRQQVAIRELSQQPGHLADRVARGPQRRRARAEGDRLILRHAQNKQTGTQQVRQVAAMGRGIGVQLRLAAAEYVVAQLRPLRQPGGSGLDFGPTDLLPAQRLGFRRGGPGVGRRGW